MTFHTRMARITTLGQAKTGAAQQNLMGFFRWKTRKQRKREVTMNWKNRKGKCETESLNRRGGRAHLGKPLKQNEGEGKAVITKSKSSVSSEGGGRHRKVPISKSSNGQGRRIGDPSTTLPNATKPSTPIWSRERERVHIRSTQII